jgi:hypothetical protein
MDNPSELTSVGAVGGGVGEVTEGGDEVAYTTEDVPIIVPNIAATASAVEEVFEAIFANSSDRVPPVATRATPVAVRV